MSFLRIHQCDEIQGYYFSKPLTVDKMDKLRGDIQSHTSDIQVGDNHDNGQYYSRRRRDDCRNQGQGGSYSNSRDARRVAPIPSTPSPQGCEFSQTG